jgi:hypothetical protein
MQIFLGVESMHYAIHTLGLMELLKFGMVKGADKEYLWSIVDNTYIDDVSIEGLQLVWIMLDNS